MPVPSGELSSTTKTETSNLEISNKNFSIFSISLYVGITTRCVRELTVNLDYDPSPSRSTALILASAFVAFPSFSRSKDHRCLGQIKNRSSSIWCVVKSLP